MATWQGHGQGREPEQKSKQASKASVPSGRPSAPPFSARGRQANSITVTDDGWVGARARGRRVVECGWCRAWLDQWTLATIDLM